jgi:hypothetical protein
MKSRNHKCERMPICMQERRPSTPDQETAALRGLLALDQRDIESGRYRDLDTFLRELDEETDLR